MSSVNFLKGLILSLSGPPHYLDSNNVPTSSMLSASYSLRKDTRPYISSYILATSIMADDYHNFISVEEGTYLEFS